MGKLLRVYRVAEILDCCKSQIYALIKSGDLSVVRLGERGIRIKEYSVQEYLRKMEDKID